MGTPDFAVPALETLANTNEHEVCLVVTQPDRRQGRGGRVCKSDVKICAESYGIPVFQPARIKTPEAVRVLRQQGADIIVVAAYGQILSQEILDLTPCGCINIHGSLLPRYRGAAPIQWAVLNGEKESGLTIMQMDAGLDTGDILLQEAVELGKKETAESLYDKLSCMGGPLLLKALEAIGNGTVKRTPQDNAKSSYAKMLSREMGSIAWSVPAVHIERLVRGLNPWPSAYTHYDGKLMKIWDADVVPGASIGDPGEIMDIGRDYIRVATGEGCLDLKEVQTEGKKRMPVSSFLLGCRMNKGEFFN